jgi:hypothetical protein
MMGGPERTSASEEIVELASLELEHEPHEEHASYIENWLKVLRADKRAIFYAADNAQRAADFLHKLQPTAGEGTERTLSPAGLANTFMFLIIQLRRWRCPPSTSIVAYAISTPASPRRGPCRRRGRRYWCPAP